MQQCHPVAAQPPHICEIHRNPTKLLFKIKQTNTFFFFFPERLRAGFRLNVSHRASEQYFLSCYEILSLCPTADSKRTKPSCLSVQGAGCAGLGGLGGFWRTQNCTGLERGHAWPQMRMHLWSKTDESRHQLPFQAAGSGPYIPPLLALCSTEFLSSDSSSCSLY